MSVREKERSALWRASLRLRPRGRRAKSSLLPPSMFLFTDPDRTPDPVRTAAGLPRGAGVVFRGFGRPQAGAEALGLARASKRQGLWLMIGSDERLAVAVRARGVHLPEREIRRAPRLRQRHPQWLITGAAHSSSALRAAEASGLDAVFVSAVFPSRSPSAGRPLGPIRLAAMIRGARIPVYALGGVDGRTARRLQGTGVVGFAAVGALEPAGSVHPEPRSG